MSTPQPPAPPAAPTIKLPADFFVCFILADLAVHIVTGMASQARFVGREEEANVFTTYASQFATFRDEIRNAGAKAIVIAAPGDLPKG